MWRICMPNFGPLASLVWEEEEVTNGHVMLSILKQIPIQNF